MIAAPRRIESAVPGNRTMPHRPLSGRNDRISSVRNKGLACPDRPPGAPPRPFTASHQTMRMDIELRLRHLTCLQPEESADEPFAWVFYLALDGSTITQNRVNTDRLVSNVVVTGNTGSHGNLGVDEVEPGRHFPIPPGIGTYAATLKPIRISFGADMVVPGRVVGFFVLLDEDATSDHDIEVAHEKLIVRVQQRFNEFVQGISLSEVMIEAAQLRIGRPELDLPGAATEIIQARVDAFTDQVTGELEDYVQEVVIEESNVFQLVENFVDGDDFIGSFRFVPDERTMLASSLSVSVAGQVRFKPNDWRHVYDIGAEATARLVPGSEELARVGRVLSDSVGGRGEFVTSGQQLCIANGTRIGWTRHDLREQWDFAFGYPFAEVVWTIEGVDLPPGRAPGTVDVAKTVRRARTDVPPAGTRLQSATEERTVQVGHTRTRDGGVERLSLSNRPEDGQYALAVGLSIVLPNGVRIAVPPSEALFDGQSVRLDPGFLREYDACIATFDRRGRRSKTVDPWDLWGPYGREQILDRTTRELAVIAQVRGLSATRAAGLAAAAARQLDIAARLTADDGTGFAAGPAARVANAGAGTPAVALPDGVTPLPAAPPSLARSHAGPDHQR